MRRPPSFWAAGHEADLGARLLAPVGAAYGWATARRIAHATPEIAPVPVVCVGNASLGGVGKTPFAGLLLERLVARGRTPHVLTRGYGGRERGPHRVGADDDAARVGDEALLLARAAPVWVSADRPAGARAAVAAGADVIVMDDGFQNPSLAKSLSFLLADAGAPFGNGRVFPAGPLREPPARAAARADAVVSVGRGPAPRAIAALAADRPLIRAWLEIDASGFDGPVHAFAGIGRPERFFASVEGAGSPVRARAVFPDHHPYTEADLEPLIEAARADGLPLLTTQKDAVRVPRGLRGAVHAVPARMTSPDEEIIDDLLEGV